MNFEELKNFVRPFILVNGIILLKGAVNDISGFFSLDTGTAETTLNSAHISLQDTVENTGVHMFNRIIHRNSAYCCKAMPLSILGLNIVLAKTLCVDLTFVETTLQSIMQDLVFLGSIGLDLLRKNRLVIDYPCRELIINPVISPTSSETIPLIPDTLPVAIFESAGNVFRFAVDTGANTCLLSQDAAIKISGNTNIISEIQIPELRLGNRCYSNMHALVADISSLQRKIDIDGIVGYQLFAGRRIYLDLKKEVLSFLC